MEIKKLTLREATIYGVSGSSMRNSRWNKDDSPLPCREMQDYAGDGEQWVENQALSRIMLWSGRGGTRVGMKKRDGSPTRDSARKD